MPLTRLRTCATATGDVRPGSSVVIGTLPLWTVTTETSGICVFGAAADFDPPQPAIARGRRMEDAMSILRAEFIVSVPSVAETFGMGIGDEPVRAESHVKLRGVAPGVREGIDPQRIARARAARDVARGAHQAANFILRKARMDLRDAFAIRRGRSQADGCAGAQRSGDANGEDEFRYLRVHDSIPSGLWKLHLAPPPCHRHFEPHAIHFERNSLNAPCRETCERRSPTAPR